MYKQRLQARPGDLFHNLSACIIQRDQRASSSRYYTLQGTCHPSIGMRAHRRKCVRADIIMYYGLEGKSIERIFRVQEEMGMDHLLVCFFFLSFCCCFSAYVFGIRGTVVLRDALRFDNADVIHITGKFHHQRINSECVMKFSNRSFLIMARDSAYRVLYHLYHSSQSV